MKILTLLALAFAPVLAQGTSAQSVGRFEIHFDGGTFEAPFSGDVFVAFAEEGEPRQAMHGWFGAPPLMRFEVKDVAPGTSVTLGFEEAVAFHPTDWNGAVEKSWVFQAVARRSLTGRKAGLDPGDAFGPAVEGTYARDGEGVLELSLERTVQPADFPETERLRLFEFVSPSLSEFHGFDYTLQAGVLLPRDYEPDTLYPVVYSVTGFGGTHENITGWTARVQGTALENCIVVVPDASNRYGHSVFCDSASIGPWGQALVKELIPELEETFGGAGAEHRYVTGVSSGGWSSLWLQVTYPDDFAGCFSHVPDPIDFHDFQGINLYEPLADGSPRNMYVDENGDPRPLARRGDTVMLTYEYFVRREHVTNPGGQIRSFEGTFSPPGEDGTPRRVFDVATGRIDHAAATAWRSYDISNTLLTGWDELKAGLTDKIHVYAGEVDTFYLEGAVERFRALAEPAGLLEDMVIEVIPGMPHTLYQPGHDLMVETVSANWAAAQGGD